MYALSVLQGDAVDGIAPRLAAATQQALGQATSPQEWNTYLLASPDFMHR